jgi:hypothetical protein
MHNVGDSTPAIYMNQLLTRYRFSSISHLLDDVPLRKELCKHFPNVPRMFWSKTCVQHNGFFGTKTSADPSSTPFAPAPPRVETWFRMIVKSIHAATKTADFTQYAWYEMSFISTCSKDRNMLLCLDTPRSLTWNMLNVLSEEENEDAATGPYGLHQLLLEQLMVVYDESVWDVARIMRNNEKSKGVCIIISASILQASADSVSTQPMGNTDLHYFIKLYEDSRHTVHSIEATQEATKVVECIAQQCQSLALRPNPHQELLSSRAEMLRFHHTMMQGFLARAVSNDRRMGNEQNLVTTNILSETYQQETKRTDVKPHDPTRRKNKRRHRNGYKRRRCCHENNRHRHNVIPPRNLRLRLARDEFLQFQPR